MPDNTFSPEQMGALRAAVRFSRRQQECYRRNRVQILRSIVGRWYSDNGSQRTQPLPLMRQALNVVSRLVAPHQPRVNITSFIPQWRPKAFEFKLALNWLFDRLYFGETLQDVVSDAMVSGGVVKVGMSKGNEFEYEGSNYNAGVPFCERVSPDDFVWEETAYSWRRMSFRGDYYRVPLDWVKDNRNYSKKAREKVTASDFDNSVDQIGEEPSRNIGRGDAVPGDRFEESVQLLDLYLPRYGVLLTLDTDSEDWAEPLDIVEWDGPPCGPYYMLGFDRIPDNVWPLGPLATLRDTSESANKLARKLINQAERQKSFVGVQGGAGEDGERVMKVSDGQMIRIDNPAGAQQFDIGGPSQPVSGVMLLLQELFDRYGGNISALGGLSPQAATLGQDELLSGSASKQIEDYRERVSLFVRDIAYALGQHIWNDPTFEAQLVKKIDVPGGQPIELPFTWGPLQRTGDFLRFNVEIEPYSMQYAAPAQKAQALMQILTSVVIPILPLAQQQGAALNVNRTLEILGEYLGLPELGEVMTFSSPSGGPVRGEMGDELPMKPATSNRTYTRVNRPGATQQGKDATLIQMLLGGGGAQSSQQAALARPTG